MESLGLRPGGLFAAGLLCASSALLGLAVDEPVFLAQFGIHYGVKAPARLSQERVTRSPALVAATWCLSVVLFLALLVLFSAPDTSGVRPAMLTGAASALLLASLFASAARQVRWLPVAYILGVAGAVAKADAAMAPVMAAVAAALLLPMALGSFNKKAGSPSPAAASAPPICLGATAFSGWKSFAFCSSFALGCLLESSGCWNFPEGERLLQPVWDFLLRVGWPYVTHKFFAGFVATAAYFVSCTYFSVLDLIKSDTKVQTDWWPTLRTMWPAFWPQALIYGLGQVAMWAVWVFQPEENTIELPKAAPSLWHFGWNMAVFLVVGDFLIYWEHRFMHTVPFLRNHIHSVHHTYTAVFSWAGGWVHPLEDAVVVFCQIAAPLAIGTHPLTLWTFAWLWVVCLIDEHSGHDVWWSFYQILPCTGYPLGGGAAPHDIHHYKPNKNYSFVFIIWDRLFGTFEAVDPNPQNPYVPPYKLERRADKCSTPTQRAERVGGAPVR